MASGYTENYGLCQWQGEDKFLREEFNQDNAKIDAALKAAEDKAAVAAQSAQQTADRALKGLEDQSYNVYNLILQNYYEGKYTGYKRGLIFDGFLDESGVEEKDDELLVRDKALRLSSVDEESWTDAGSSYGTPYYGAFYTQTRTAVGAGVLAGFRFTIRYTGSSSTVKLQIWLNGTQVREQEVTFTTLTGNREVTLEEPLLLLPGDQYWLGFPKGGASSLDFAVTSENCLAGTALITPLAAEEGTLTVTEQAMPEGCAQVMLFARSAGGAVTPTLAGTELTLYSTRQTQTMDGIACTEQEWRGSAPAGETLTLTWTLTAGEDGCTLYDYGLLLL